MLIIFLLSIVNGILGSFIKSDPCSLLKGKPVVRAELALACYDIFPFDNNTRTEVINTLIKGLDLAVTDQKDEILQGLNRISNQAFSTDRSFHTALTEEYFKRKSVKFTYNSHCYTKFVFQQPLILFAFVDEENQTRFLANLNPGVLNETLEIWTQTGINLFKLQYAEVIQIEGEDPESFLTKFSDYSLSASYDKNAKLNSVLAGMIYEEDKYIARPGLFSQSYIPPRKPTISFKLKLQDIEETTDITLPYVAYIPPVESSNQFYQTYCQLNNDKSQRRQVNNDIQRRQLNSKPKLSLSLQLGKRKSRQAVEDWAPISLYSGNISRGFKVNDNTAALLLPSFKQIDNWWNEVHESLKQFHENNLSTLIIDLSYNFGGKNCHAYQLASQLLGFTPTINLTISNSPNIQSLYNSSQETIFHRSYYNSISENPILFQEKCETFNFNLPYHPEKIILVSDSNCYNTCSLFSHLMSHHPNLYTVSVGGINSIKGQIGSIIGGTDITFDRLQKISLPNFNFNLSIPIDHHIPIIAPHLPEPILLSSKHTHINHNYDTFDNPFKIWSILA